MLQRTLNEYIKFYVKFNTIDFLVAYVVEFKTVKNDGKYEIELQEVLFFTKQGVKEFHLQARMGY